MNDFEIVQSIEINELAVALHEFQNNVESVKKDARNPHFGKKYASLSSLVDTIREPLYEAGLSFMQFPTGEHCLHTRIIHKSGQYLGSTYKMTPVKNDPQGIGSSITYQRRYALAAALGLSVEDDDDGNEASKAKPESKGAKAQPKPEPAKEQLNPKHPKWQGAVESLANGKCTIDQIKAKYILFDMNEEQLVKEVEAFKNQTA